MCIELPFDPFPLFKGSHRQTIFSSLISRPVEPISKTFFVTLPDDDCLALEETIPSDWSDSDPTVLMLHGLCGSHSSPYLVRMTHHLEEKGIRSLRMNFRGCGSGKGKAKSLYHAGQSDDVKEVLKVIKNNTPHSPIVLIGFSMGGNVALKLAGELADQADRYFNAVISVVPPVDLLSSVNMFATSSGKMYEKYFLKILKADIDYRCSLFTDLPKVNFPKKMRFFDFDNLYTAPFGGFENALDYYNRASSKKVVQNIDLPCKILFSEDDPLVSSTSLDDTLLPSNIEVYKTKRGGHMGFLTAPTKERTIFWLDHILMDWIQQGL